MMIFPTLYIWTEFPCVSGEDGFIPPASECCPSDLVLTAISPSTFMAGVWTVQTIDSGLCLHLYPRVRVTRRAARRSAVTELPARWIAVFLAAAAGPRLGNLCNLRNQTQNIIHSRAAPRRPARLHTPQLKARRGLSCGLQMRLTAGSNDVSDW